MMQKNFSIWKISDADCNKDKILEKPIGNSTVSSLSLVLSERESSEIGVHFGFLPVAFHVGLERIANQAMHFGLALNFMCKDQGSRAFGSQLASKA